MIPYGRQSISQEDIEAIVEVLRSPFITQGPKVPEFEDAIKHYTGAQFATAVNSATSALHIALLALDVGKGDIVWTSTNTFVATANAALLCGASVSFVDIEPNSRNISISALEDKLIYAASIGKLPKVVVPVHFAGQACEMSAIYNLSKRFDFKILEDASHAIGANYNNEKIGCCNYSDICVFSFHPVKIITSAEGGMATTNNHTLFKKMNLLRSHGVTRDLDPLKLTNSGGWHYEQHLLGLNYRMNDIQASLGASQMKRLDSFVLERKRIAEKYNKFLEGCPLKLPEKSESSAWHLYVVECESSEVRKNMFDNLRALDVLVNVHYMPVHLQPYYQSLGFKKGDCPVAELYSSRCISLPIYYELSEKQDKVIHYVKEFFS